MRSRLIAKVAYLPSTRRYPSLDAARANLKALTSTPRNILLAPTHVKGLRISALGQFTTGLATIGCVEVTGPAGLGKSAFIREGLALQEEQSKRAITLILRDRPFADVSDLARNLLESLGYDPEALQDDELVFARLFDIDATVWFRKAKPPASALVELAERVVEAQNRRFHLVIESQTHLLPEALRIVLLPLSPSDIYRILLLQPPSAQAEPDVNRIARQSQGNPALAIAYWRSRDSDTVPDRSGEFKWIPDCFDAFERKMLGFVVLFLKDAPLGLTPSLIGAVACNIYKNEMPIRVREAVESVLSQLEAAQLIHVDRLSRDFIAATAGATGDDFVTINKIDGSLVQFVTTSLDSRDTTSLVDRITAELIDDHSGTTGSLAEVTASLRTGELWPFCTSAFRYTHRGGVLTWLDQKPQSNYTMLNDQTLTFTLSGQSAYSSGCFITRRNP